MISNGRPTIPLPEQNSANLMATTLAMFECPNASIAFAIGNAITKKLKQLFNPFSIAFTKSFVFLIVLTVCKTCCNEEKHHERNNIGHDNAADKEE